MNERKIKSIEFGGRMKFAPLNERIMRGELLDIHAAAEASGYCEQHLRRLCFRKIVAHERRGYKYFFTPEQVKALFHVVTPVKK